MAEKFDDIKKGDKAVVAPADKGGYKGIRPLTSGLAEGPCARQQPVAGASRISLDLAENRDVEVDADVDADLDIDRVGDSPMDGGADIETDYPEIQVVYGTNETLELGGVTVSCPDLGGGAVEALQLVVESGMDEDGKAASAIRLIGAPGGSMRYENGSMVLNLHVVPALVAALKDGSDDEDKKG